MQHYLSHYSLESTQLFMYIPSGTYILWVPTYLTPLFPPMTMAVLEANGKPTPAAPDPLPSQMPSETPHAPLSTFTGSKTSWCCPIWVHHDPGTICHIWPPQHHHHGTPPMSNNLPWANYQLKPSFDMQKTLAQLHQPTIDQHCHHPSHQHQPEGHHSPPHLPCTKHANQPELHYKVWQVTNSNSTLTVNYTTDNQSKQVLMIDTLDFFTPIIHNSRQTDPQSAAWNLSSYYTKNPTMTTTQHLATTGNHNSSLSLLSHHQLPNQTISGQSELQRRYG